MSDGWAVLAAVGVLLLYSGLTATSAGPRSGPMRALERAITEAGYRIAPAGLVALSASGGIGAAVAALTITGSMVVAATAFIAAAWVPFGSLRARRERRRSAFRAAWPDALATMIAGIRAGISLPEVCSSLAARGPEELRGAFRVYSLTYRATGSFPAALADLRDELAEPVADRVTAALQLAHEVGGTELVRVLRTLADFVREDLRIRDEIEARWSWTVTAARVAAASPWIVLVVMATRPEAAAAYESPAGVGIILAGAAATAVGYRAMLSAARLPAQRRLEL